MSILIRDEQPRDYAAVRAINEAAFETPAEAGLVETLRERAKPVVSLVAEIEGNVRGHLLFSPVTVEGHVEFNWMGLAPMAVDEEWRGRGIGTALIEEGLKRCRDLGIGAVVVLGHTDYYPRFDFRAASEFGIRCEYDVPDEAFMLIELEAGATEGVEGIAKYHAAFGEL